MSRQRARESGRAWPSPSSPQSITARPNKKERTVFGCESDTLFLLWGLLSLFLCRTTIRKDEEIGGERLAAYITYSPFLGPASYDSSFFLHWRLRLNAKRLFLSFLSIARTHSSRAQKGLKVANEQTKVQTYERTTYVGFSLSDSLSLYSLSERTTPKMHLYSVYFARLRVCLFYFIVRLGWKTSRREWVLFKGNRKRQSFFSSLSRPDSAFWN